MAKDIEVKKERSPQAGFFPDFERMAEDFFETRLPSLFERWPTFARRMGSQLRDESEAYVLQVDLPGLPSNEIQVSVNGDILTIHAEHQQRENSPEREYRKEYRSFHQSFFLPSNVKIDQIEAFSENGRLEIYMPKTEGASEKRIEVKTGTMTPRNKH